MPTTAVEAHELDKAYELRPVRRGPSFAVGHGGIFGITGHDGAARTTIEVPQGLRRRAAGRLALLVLDSARERARTGSNR